MGKLTRCLALALFSGAAVLAQSANQPTVRPNCQLSDRVGGTGVRNYDNRTLQCSGWTLTYDFSTGITPTVVLNWAPDNSGAPGAWTAATADTNIALGNSVTATYTTVGYHPWIQLAITFTGSGTVNYLLAGYIQNPLSKSGTPSGPGGGVSASTMTAPQVVYATGGQAIASAPNTSLSTSGQMGVASLATGASPPAGGLAGATSGVIQLGSGNCPTTGAIPAGQSIICADASTNALDMINTIGGVNVQTQVVGTAVNNVPGPVGPPGHFLRSNGTTYVDSVIQAGDAPGGTGNVSTSTSNTYTSGLTQIMPINAAPGLASLNIGVATSTDPPAPNPGDLWINGTAFKYRAGTTSYAVGALNLLETWTSQQTFNAGAFKVVCNSTTSPCIQFQPGTSTYTGAAAGAFTDSITTSPGTFEYYDSTGWATGGNAVVPRYRKISGTVTAGTPLALTTVFTPNTSLETDWTLMGQMIETNAGSGCAAGNWTLTLAWTDNGGTNSYNVSVLNWATPLAGASGASQGTRIAIPNYPFQTNSATAVQYSISAPAACSTTNSVMTYSLFFARLNPA